MAKGADIHFHPIASCRRRRFPGTPRMFVNHIGRHHIAGMPPEAIEHIELAGWQWNLHRTAQDTSVFA